HKRRPRGPPTQPRPPPAADAFSLDSFSAFFAAFISSRAGSVPSAAHDRRSGLPAFTRAAVAESPAARTPTARTETQHPVRQTCADHRVTPDAGDQNRQDRLV